MSYGIGTQFAIPFFFAGGIAPQDRQRAGTGQYRLPGARTAGTSFNLTHDLARVPVCVILVDNGTLVQTTLQITARTSTSVTIVPTAALSASAILFIG